MYESCFLMIALNLQCPWAINPKSCAHHSKLVIQVGNAVAKQPVAENNNVVTSKTSEVHNEVRGISVSLLHSATHRITSKHLWYRD